MVVIGVIGRGVLRAAPARTVWVVGIPETVAYSVESEGAPETPVPKRELRDEGCARLTVPAAIGTLEAVALGLLVELRYGKGGLLDTRLDSVAVPSDRAEVVSVCSSSAATKAPSMIMDL